MTKSTLVKVAPPSSPIDTLRYHLDAALLLFDELSPASAAGASCQELIEKAGAAKIL